MKIPITKPFIDAADKQAIQKPLETGWLVQGPFVAEFERRFAEFTKSRFAVATSNCTTALHLALEALNMGRGDKVVVPSFTYVASANAVEYTRAEVIFCDIELKTFNIDTDRLEEILKKDKTHKIKAVMPVNLFGLCADLPRVSHLAQEYGFKIIEDSACGLGAYIAHKHSGTFGDAGCFSFHPRKPITTGEGGMLISNNKNIANKVNALRDHGASQSDLSRHKEKRGSLLPEFDIVGYNYRMTDFQGALGVSQLQKAVTILRKRAHLAKKYDLALKDIGFLKKPFVPPRYIHSYQSYVCLYIENIKTEGISLKTIAELNIKRNRLMTQLEKKGISTRQGTHAVHTLGYYKKKYGLKNSDHLKSFAADRLSIALPLYATMTNEEFDYVMTHMKRWL